MEPQIITPDFKGRHNKDIPATVSRLEKAQSYTDQSTVIICPTRGQIPAKVVATWLGLLRPMNQKVMGPMFALGMEVGDAYNQMISVVLANPELSKFKYIFTCEEDNTLPPDVLLRLYESIEGKVNGKKYDAVSGLYFTKGEGGQPQIYGNPAEMPRNYMPQRPINDQIVECNGIGMGAALYRLSMFKKMEKPWFKTQQEVVPGEGTKCFSQDLYWCDKAALHGFRLAVDCRVKVGHYDYAGQFGPEDTVW